MCQCLSFLVLPQLSLHEKWAAWKCAFALFCHRVQAWFCSPEVELFRLATSGNIDPRTTPAVLRRRLLQLNALAGQPRIEAWLLSSHTVLSNGECHHGGQQNSVPEIAASSREGMKQMQHATMNGGDDFISLYTKQGLKGVNQDAMLVLQDFSLLPNTIICGVFDGHGPHGHLVAQNVRDILPVKLASSWKSFQEIGITSAEHQNTSASEQGDKAGHRLLVSMWGETFVNAYKLIDRELLRDDKVDCFSSGTTAVTLIKQGNDLIIANVGDSRAVLGVKMDDNSVRALQLTVDLTPNLPKEAERIRRCKGRVFAMSGEPSVMRVWLPHENSPGLAMARALGDYRLKTFGVISVPEITYRQLRENDQFVVLATDGIWDVLTNKQVVHIVDTAPARSLAAKAVVDAAVEVWKYNCPGGAKMDDCAVVCLFFNSFSKSFHGLSTSIHHQQTC